MKNRVWIVLLVISLGVNIGFLSHWLWPRNGHGRTAGWHVSPLKHGLGLSSEQAQQLEKERQQVVAQAQPLQDELRGKRRELFVLLKKQTVSNAELDPILGEISRLQTAIEKMFILHSLKVRGYFSPDQMHKFENYLEQGLCPGVMAGTFCPPGQMAGGAACMDGGINKKANSKR